MRRQLSVLCVLLALGTPLAAADLTGNWWLYLMPDFGGDNDTVDCSFLQEGAKLALTCGNASNINGEVQGGRVTFGVPTGLKNELIATFTGELDSSETTISGTWATHRRSGSERG